VERMLKSCRPSLLGRGGAIPPATLAAFRCGDTVTRGPAPNAVLCWAGTGGALFLCSVLEVVCRLLSLLSLKCLLV
jgi:hypothetical protein